MGKISITTPEARTTWRIGDRLSDEQKAHYSMGEQNATKSIYFPVEDEHLELFESHILPGEGPESHAHSEDEIIVVMSGSMYVGARQLSTGAAIYVEKDTLYTFRAGEDGCTILNFRPHPGATYESKDEHISHRRAEGQSAAV